MRQATIASGKPYELDEGDLAGPDEELAFGPDRPAFDLRAIWALLYRNRLAIILILAAAFLIGLASILFTPRVYQASASVQIDQQTTKVLGTEDTEPVIGGQDADRFLQTQVDVLNSRAMAKRVSDRLALDKSDDFLTAMGASSLADLTAEERQNAVIEALLSNLGVDLRRNSRVVGISFRSRDPAVAARIANTYSQEFIQSNIQRKFSTGDYSRQFLQNQLGLAKDRLEASERALISYARASRLIDASNGATAQGDSETPRSLITANLVQLNRAFADAKAARLEAQERWEQARDVPVATLPEVLSNQAMQGLLQQRAELNADMGEMRQHLKPDHPTVLRVAAQLNELDSQARGLGESIRNSIRNQYLTAQRQEQAIEAQVAALKSATLSEQDLGVRYNILRREVDTNRQLYESLLQRFKELSAEAGVTNNNITVVDAAEVPRKPASPRPMLNMALALAAGCILALLYAYGREKLDDAIRDPRDVESKLHLPLLGVVPEFTGSNLHEALDAPYSDVAEAYYAVRSSLELSSNRGLPPSLMITSSNKGEGKSTTSYVLARDLARLGRKVLLIDADLRRPSLHRYFDVPTGSPGLSSVLAKLVPADEAIRPAGEGQPAFMPSGPLPPDPANLFAGSAFDSLLNDLNGRYDVVVVDAPPVMALADAVELAAAADATVFVVEAGTAHFGQARTAVSRLVRGRSNVIGCVVTKYNPRKVGYTSDSDYYNYAYTKEA
jgi:polysaccharide biosynthesis transport protein